MLSDIKYNADAVMKIGILSDTHGVVAPQVYTFFADCDELWHAGDMGPHVLETLQAFKPVVAVHGNVDGWDVRHLAPKVQLFRREGHRIMMTHIGGHPGHYDRTVLPLIREERPDIFVCGHSHILRVMYDRQYEMLAINPGAAGRQGFHQVSTLVRFVLEDKPTSMEVLDFPKFAPQE